MAWIQSVCAAHPQASGLVLFAVIVSAGEGLRRGVLWLQTIADALLAPEELQTASDPKGLAPRAAGLNSERRRIS